MADPSRVRISGVLQPFAVGFAAELGRQGYTPRSLQTQLYLMAPCQPLVAREGPRHRRFAGTDAAVPAGPAGGWLQAASDGQGVAPVADVPA